MNKLRWSLPFLFALLFWSSFHPLNLGFLGWVALVPLLVYAKTTSGKKSFFVAWLGGAVAFGGCFSWVWHTAPPGPFFLGLYNGFYVALFVVLVRRLGVGGSPVVWTGLEFVRGTLFGGLPWFLVGYTQHESFHLIQIADLGGIWLVSALVALVNAAVVAPRPALRWVAAGAVVLSFVYGIARLRFIPLKEGPKIAVVQPNIPQDIKIDTHQNLEKKLEVYQKHVELTILASQGNPDLIVWPEAAVYEGLVWDRSQNGWLRDSWYERVVDPAHSVGTRMLIGLLIAELDRVERYPDWYQATWTNSAVYVDPREGILSRFDKVHLVPFSEYVPLAKTFPFLRTGLKAISGLYLLDMRPGPGFPVWEAAGRRRFGTQICFEAIFPEISREIARNGADFTVNISNDGWFRASGELDQMLAMARFRAIENRMSVIRATNTGISAFIAPTGAFDAVLEKDGKRKEVEGILTARVRIAEGGSLFRTVGDLVGWLAVIVTLGALARRFFVDTKQASE